MTDETETLIAHTPGPWKIRDFRDSGKVKYIDYNGRVWAYAEWPIQSEIGERTVARVGTRLVDTIRPPIKNYHEAEANAHLIAAAPELLDAIESMVLVSSNMATTEEQCRVALDKAIDKAINAAKRARGEAK